MNTLTAEDKYCRNIRENFPQQIQFQLSKKLKPFYQIFIAFVNYR